MSPANSGVSTSEDDENYLTSSPLSDSEENNLQKGDEVFPISEEIISQVFQFAETSNLLVGCLEILPDAQVAALRALYVIGGEPDSFREQRVLIAEYSDSLRLVASYPDGERISLSEKQSQLFISRVEEGVLVLQSAGIALIPHQQYRDGQWAFLGHGEDLAESLSPETSASKARGGSASYTYRSVVEPTEEQGRVIEATSQLSGSEVLKTKAFAGTGKTTLCDLITQGKEGFIYLAFNKAMQEQAEKRLYDSVETRTVDSLAYVVVKPWERWGQDRIKYETRTDYQRIADELGLPGNFAGFTRASLAKVVDQVLNNYCNSGDEFLALAHVPETDFPDSVEENLVEWAVQLWERIISESGWIPIRPQHVMKWWEQIGGVIPDRYEHVIFDEAQDANGAFMNILARSSTRRILIGDHHQQLYQWRGAVDAMSKIQGDEYAITQSWRFGASIADYANSILQRKTTPPIQGVIGNSGISSEVYVYNEANPPEWPVAVLARTNADVFYKAVQIAEAGHMLHIVGGMSNMKRLLLDALQLYRGAARPYRHYALTQFSTWMALVYTEETTGDAELRRVRKIVERDHERLEEQLHLLERYHQENERREAVILSTTHKVKGREWERVMLLNDFISHETVGDYEGETRDMELNTLYVAATRAIRKLYIPRSLDFRR